jgi:glutamate-ammonia-ligase adenylyltransferase
MTEAHRGGAIYAVDMRLRPNGHAGPMLMSEKSLETYLSNQAAPWERQAYLRARPLQAIAFSPAQVGSARGVSKEDLTELAMIRSKLFHPPRVGEIDLKLTDGGLADVEFTTQIALLKRREFSIDPSTSGMIKTLEQGDAEWASIGSELSDRYRFLRGVEQLFQLTTSQSGSKLRTKSDEFRRLSLVMKCEPQDLEAQIIEQIKGISDLLVSVTKGL